MISEQEKKRDAELQKQNGTVGGLVGKLFENYLITSDYKAKENKDPNNLYLVVLIAILAVLLGYAYYSRRK